MGCLGCCRHGDVTVHTSFFVAFYRADRVETPRHRWDQIQIRLLARENLHCFEERSLDLAGVVLSLAEGGRPVERLGGEVVLHGPRVGDLQLVRLARLKRDVLRRERKLPHLDGHRLHGVPVCSRDEITGVLHPIAIGDWGQNWRWSGRRRAGHGDVTVHAGLFVALYRADGVVRPGDDRHKVKVNLVFGEYLNGLEVGRFELAFRGLSLAEGD